MRIAVLLAAASIAATDVAAEIERAEVCSKESDQRTIEVVTPGTVGTACDVVYTRAGGADASVPYYANMDKDYCRARAAELAATLASQGFNCAASDSAAIEAALEGGSAVAANAAPPAEVVPESETLGAQLARLDQQEVGAAAEPPPETTPDVPVEPVAPEIAERLVQPESKPISPVAETQTPTPSEPVQLARDVRTSEYRAPKPPKSTGAGRIVGAQPSIEDIIDVSTAPTATASGADASAASGEGVPARPLEDMIKNLLAANAAAWNEGNLDAFMNGYVNTADLMLIDDAIVTAGWSHVRKTFEKDVAASGEMGRLAFSKLDVRMTSDDVASIVGRYSLARTTGTKSGVVTIVMKQTGGQWRIAQETRIADAQSTN